MHANEERQAQRNGVHLLVRLTDPIVERAEDGPVQVQDEQ
jgi:hypothetical protein